MNIIISEFLNNPVAFCGGFISGVLRWDLSQEPLKSWLENQGVYVQPNASSQTGSGTTSGPKNIKID